MQTFHPLYDTLVIPTFFTQNSYIKEEINMGYGYGGCGFGYGYGGYGGCGFGGFALLIVLFILLIIIGASCCNGFVF